MKKFLLISFVVALVFAPSTSHALTTLVSGTSEHDLGFYTGTLDYSWIDLESYGLLEISLTNTSPDANGGYLTGFAFNDPTGGSISGVDFYTDPNYLGFVLFGSPSFVDGVNAQPYGWFDVGMGTGTNFQGSGNPSEGIAVGDTGTFIFHLTGSGLDGLIDQSFFDAVSVTATGAATDYSFVARFAGFEDGGSDKVPGHVIPEPATMALFGLGLLGSGALKLKKKR